jgi:hypothetical protein
MSRNMPLLIASRCNRNMTRKKARYSIIVRLHTTHLNRLDSKLLTERCLSNTNVKLLVVNHGHLSKKFHGIYIFQLR